MSEISKNYSLITLGWKSVENLRSVITTAISSTIRPYEIIIVINPYNGEIQERILSFIRQVPQLLQENGILFKGASLTHNVGVGPAWNLAMCMASQDNLIVINDDCKVANNVFEKMVNKLNENPLNGMVGVEWGGKPEEDFGPTPKGFLIGLRKEMLNKIGMFRESHAPFADERELGLRALVNNWNCVIAEGCSYHHVCDFSSNIEIPIPYLENTIIPVEFMAKIESRQQAIINNHNKILNSRKTSGNLI